MNDKQTIAIIGAGPAACATALSLQQAVSTDTATNSNALSIHLFDTSKITQAAIGETIPPAATSYFYQLGIGNLINDTDHLQCHGSLAFWGSNSANYNDFLQDPIGKGYHLNREYFNQQLRESVLSKKIKIHTHHHLAAVNVQDTYYQLLFKITGLTAKPKQINFKANYVVDASGISAAFARRLGVARNKVDEVIALSVIVDATKETLLQSYTLVEAVEAGWWYAARLPQNKLIISFYSDQIVIKEKQLKRFSNWLYAFKKTQHLREQVSLRCLRHSPVIHIRVAPSTILSKVIGDRWLAVGDAASSYDPVSSAGISKALQNGVDAGQALFEYCNNLNRTALLEYEKCIFNDFNQYIALHRSLYHAEQRYRNAPFWKRRRVFL